MYEPEDFLNTLEHMIELTLGVLSDEDGQPLSEEARNEIVLDLAVLRDLQERIRIQFGIDKVILN
jgi:hypothetical protein